jgi:hypothetical protein
LYPVEHRIIGSEKFLEACGECNIPCGSHFWFIHALVFGKHPENSSEMMIAERCQPSFFILLERSVNFFVKKYFKNTLWVNTLHTFLF